MTGDVHTPETTPDAPPDAPPDASRGAVRPHPVLPAYYRSAGQRTSFVRGLFNKTAVDYDRINTVFSLGSGGPYRRHALRQAGLRPGLRILDVAVGTGLVAQQAVRITRDPNAVIGLDLSENMLAVARAKLGIPLVQGRIEALPVADASVDLVSIGYALRHVPDLTVAFAEFHRVLRPGGRVLVLEIARPTGRMAHLLTKLYLGWVVPALCGGLRSGGAAQTLMRYYWDTIEACVPPATILQSLRDTGFHAVGCDTALGVFRAYHATKTADTATK
jgi:demethylmenaquinone methyltransferase/2-methoxy-6-polyprenyl-1,4-benzoquinol methylase